MFNSCLNYYATASQCESFRFVDRDTPYPKGRLAYVLYWETDEEFLNQEKLTLLYRGPNSEVVIAVAPDYIRSEPAIDSKDAIRSAERGRGRCGWRGGRGCSRRRRRR